MTAKITNQSGAQLFVEISELNPQVLVETEIGKPVDMVVAHADGSYLVLTKDNSAYEVRYVF